jgi:hypothetical protein
VLTSALRALCADRWQEWHGEHSPPDLAIAFIGSRSRSAERSVAVVCAGSEVRMLIKVAVDLAVLRREEDVLRALSAADIRIPRPCVLGSGTAALFATQWGAETCEAATLWALPLSRVQGAAWPLPAPNRSIGRRHLRGMLREIGQVSGQLALVPPVAICLPDPVAGWEARMSMPLGKEDEDGRRTTQTEDLWLGYPTSFAHGDLAPGNVLRHRRLLAGVLDWELAASTYEPWFDLIYPAVLGASSAPQGLRSRSWPVRWLQILQGRQSSIPLSTRISVVIAQLMARDRNLGRGSAVRWSGVADVLRPHFDSLGMV